MLCSAHRKVGTVPQKSLFDLIAPYAMHCGNVSVLEL